jgi:uncharacterized protein YdeI (YjbR/CyaY-like superfamily)
MAPSKMLYVTCRDEWRAWLAKHHESETEIWLIYYKKHSGRPRIPYDHAVEEALCFGWIDSLVKRIDGDRFAQKFTPRRNRTKWSELNKQRARKLVQAGRMPEIGLAKIDPAVFAERPQPKASGREPDIPAFVTRALRASPKAWAHFQNLAPSHRRMYILWISDAKREETRERRLREAVARLERNEKLGLK